MATWNRKNFSGKDPKDEGVQSGDTLFECNCHQKAPNTAICEGLTGLTFNGCMLRNCNVPGDAEVNGGVISQVEYCANLREFTDQDCAENCSHVVDTDEIIVDGVTVDTVYHYEHRRL